MLANRLYVCETCARDVPVAADKKTLGRTLADSVAGCLGAPSGLLYRTVLCLNGCPRPCNAALRAPGKWSFRLGGLAPEDAAAIVDLAHEYSACRDGDVPPSRWPARLRGKLTVRTPPFAPRPA